jgi:hypothetical protein
MICRYCERDRLDVECVTFQPDTCCTVVLDGWGEFRWVRRSTDFRLSDLRGLLFGTPLARP